MIEEIRLTQTVKKGGCAAKLPADDLKRVLGNLSLKTAPNLLVGTATFDDAAVWDLENGQLLIQTLDFFTPIVDSPYDFGAIAAANALSDVFAMGGSPKTALSILAFPSAHLPIELLEPLMAGALEKIHESGAVLCGGHTIDDETLKLGFSVSGFTEKENLWTNAGAQPGDVLILTKALGTGTITSGLKSGKSNPEWVQGAIKSMCLLNQVPDLLKGLTVHAATDITGFSLAGHGSQMAAASKVSFEIDVATLPALDGALELLKDGVLNRAHKTNADYVASKVTYEDVPDELRWLTLDPQTSGGLLLSIPEEEAERALGRIRERFSSAAIIGKVVDPGTHFVRFKKLK